MIIKSFFLKGIHYRNPFIYNLITTLKLKSGYNLRYRIAAQYIKAGDSVLDICSGTGKFKKFLPANCDYICIEASPEFISQLAKKKTEHKQINLHEGIHVTDLRTDVVVMIISLYQFRNTSIHNLLENFKKIAHKTVIVEQALDKKRNKDSFLQKTIDYLCSMDYFLPTALFTFDEFEQIMCQHNYACRKYNKKYIIGCYNF